MFRVRDFMTKSPITAEPSDKISEVLDLMRLHNIHRVPVVNSSDEI
ncbi:MAG: CBS domain-containing protein, partial [Ileibacterium sp.]|nr:CBS domain-containing protein [Ileibacterium sp.]